MITTSIVLLVLWLVGLITGYTLGGWIHLLLVAAIIVFFMGNSNKSDNQNRAM